MSFTIEERFSCEKPFEIDLHSHWKGVRLKFPSFFLSKEEKQHVAYHKMIILPWDGKKGNIVQWLMSKRCIHWIFHVVILSNDCVCTDGKRNNVDEYFTTICLHAEVLNENKRRLKDLEIQVDLRAPGPILHRTIRWGSQGFTTHR